MQNAFFKRSTLRSMLRDLNLLQTYESAAAVCCRFKITQESAEMVSPWSDYSTLVLSYSPQGIKSSLPSRRARRCVSRIEIKARDKTDSKSQLIKSLAARASFTTAVTAQGYSDVSEWSLKINRERERERDKDRREEKRGKEFYYILEIYSFSEFSDIKCYVQRKKIVQ